ncbi:hypothetical protein BpHYR1_021981, partial [Brachionus plicatilis]
EFSYSIHSKNKSATSTYIIDLNDSGRKLCRNNLLDSFNPEEARTPLENDDSESFQSKSLKRFTLFILAVGDQCSFSLCHACHTIYDDLKKVQD